MKIMSSFALLALLISGLLISGCAGPSPEKTAISYDAFVAIDRDAGIDTTPTLACNKTCQSRRQEFRYVVYVGKQIYCYWDLKLAETKTNFDALAISLEKSITSSTSETGFYLVLRRWASAFHDGHVNVLTKPDVSSLEIYTAPIRVEVLAPSTDHEKLIVSAIGPGANGLAVGDEVVKVNALTAKEAITQAALDASSGSTERMRRYWAGRRIVDVMGVENASQPFVLTVKPYAGGASKTVALPRSFTISPKPDPAAPAGPANTGAGEIFAQILPNGIGYLRLDGFSGNQDDFLIGAAMDSLAQTRGMIIDLRKNGGGDLSGDRVIERLSSKAVTRYKRSERLSDYALSQEPDMFMLKPDVTGMFAQWHDLVVEPLPGHHYDKPVVAVTSPWCFSACDTFSAALRGNHLATFVGEATGGGTGTPLVFNLPTSPFSFRYGVIRGETPTGEFIEGNGTSPETILEPTAKDRATGADSQLVAALAILEGKIAPTAAKVAPLTLAGVAILPAFLDANLDRSPTEEENARLLKISRFDERRDVLR